MLSKHCWFKPVSSRYGVGARLDGWYLRVRLGKSVAGMVELESGGSIPARAGCRPYDRWRISITCVKLAVRSLGIWPYLCQGGRTTASVSALPVPGRPYDH
ncbi:hypothetical protein BHE74_00056615 [Ensete ventricosum]|nr:hypothetical protein BHE74_00056615 [Ensete ventricosum]